MLASNESSVARIESLSYRPPPPLSAYVDCIWYRRGFLPNRKREYSMPTGSIDLVIDLHRDSIRVFGSPADSIGSVSSGAIVHGPQSQAFVLDAVRHVHFLGVHFRPGGGCLLGWPARELADRHVALADLWGEHAIRLRDRLIECPTPHHRMALLERELLKRVQAAPLVRPAISFALRAIDRGAAISAIDLHLVSGVGERRFRTLFTQAVGLAPKRFMRVQRVKSVLQHIAQANAPLAAIAAEHGYVDQAHMNRELRCVAGVSPSAYAPMARSPLHMEVR